MKSLKIIGEKRYWLGLTIRRNIAQIYIMERKIVVYSKNQVIKSKLQDELNRIAYSGVFTFPVKQIQNNAKEEFIMNINQRPGDDLFLLALKNAHWFWQSKEFDGYKILGAISIIK